MEAIAFQLLAFLDMNTPVLERLENAIRASYRLQFWFKDRAARIRNGAGLAAAFPILTQCSYAGFVQVCAALLLIRMLRVSLAYALS